MDTNELKQEICSKGMLIIGAGSHAITTLEKLAAKNIEVSEIANNELDERIKALGMSLESVEYNAAIMGLSINEYLDMMERMAEVVVINPTVNSYSLIECIKALEREKSFPLFAPEPDNPLDNLSAAEIRKQLK